VASVTRWQRISRKCTAIFSADEGVRITYLEAHSCLGTNSASCKMIRVHRQSYRKFFLADKFTPASIAYYRSSLLLVEVPRTDDVFYSNVSVFETAEQALRK
jgi:hypothetical protein